MNTHTKVLIDDHLATIRKAVERVRYHLKNGNIADAQQWLVPIVSAANHIDTLTSEKKVEETQ